MMDTRTGIKLLKEAQRSGGIAATDENRDALIQLCQAGLLDCMGVVPKGESKGKKVYIITNDGCKKIDAYEAAKTHSYTRIAAVSGVIASISGAIAAVAAIIGLFLH